MTGVEFANGASCDATCDLIDVSVVIAVFDAVDTISAQLGALVSQRWSGSWEIVVADNGSSDGTCDIVQEFVGLTRLVRMVDASAVRGPSFARNVGVEHARGRSIAFCDADDVVGAGWLAAIGDALADFELVAGPLEQDELNAPAWRNVHGAAVGVARQVFAGVVPFGASANLGIRREMFTLVGGFDVALKVGEDIDLCRRVALAGVELRFVSGAVVHYRNRATLRGLFSQSISYGAASVALCAAIADDRGERCRSRLAGWRNFVWLLRRLPSLRGLLARPRWVAVAGASVGRIVGSVRYRSLYL